MGQAFSEDGKVIAEAFGQTKKEVFEKLSEQAPDAAEIRIKTIKDKMAALQQAKGEMLPQDGEDMGPQAEASDDCMTEALEPSMGTMRRRDRTISFARRKQLLSFAQDLVSCLLAQGVKQHELCFIRQASQMLIEER